MGQYRGLLAGLAALGFMLASVHLLGGTLQRLPWGRVAQVAQPEPEVAAPIVRRAQQERGLLPPARSETGSVPLYRENRPRPAPRPAPVKAPGYAAGAPRSEPPSRARAAAPAKAAPRPAPAPSRPAPAAPSRFRIEGLPALGERFGVPAGGASPGTAQPAGGGPQAAAQPGGGDQQPANRPPAAQAEPEPAAWDQGFPAAAPEAAPRQRRQMRPVLQGGVATTPVEDAQPEEEPAE